MFGILSVPNDPNSHHVWYDVYETRDDGNCMTDAYNKSTYVQAFGVSNPHSSP